MWHITLLCAIALYGSVIASATFMNGVGFMFTTQPLVSDSHDVFGIHQYFYTTCDHALQFNVKADANCTCFARTRVFCIRPCGHTTSLIYPFDFPELTDVPFYRGLDATELDLLDPKILALLYNTGLFSLIFLPQTLSYPDMFAWASAFFDRFVEALDQNLIVSNVTLQEESRVIRAHTDGNTLDFMFNQTSHELYNGILSGTSMSALLMFVWDLLTHSAWMSSDNSTVAFRKHMAWDMEALALQKIAWTKNTFK